MKIYTTYKVKIKHYNHILKDTITIYRHAVDYLITVCDEHWEQIDQLEGSFDKQKFVETLIHVTKDNPNPTYDFDSKFYKMPSYMRRSAINEAIGDVSSYKSNLARWNQNPVGRGPSKPKAGLTFPSMYRKNMYNQLGDYKAQIKIYIRNTWDWLTIDLRKSDMDYIYEHCRERKPCVPCLQKIGKEWFLAFRFEEKVELNDTKIYDQTILAVDLGINTAATVSVMRSDGTILGRHFCKFTKEIDCLTHCLNRIKKVQQHGNRKTPKLWGKVDGINSELAAKTANAIIDLAVRYNADIIIFEHLDKKGKLHGPKKQKVALWRSNAVQAIVTTKAHRLGMKIRRVCAWNTSKYAYDGSGVVLRGKDGGFNTYELCKFKNGKVYKCDLSVTYNIGARYFIREILKSLDKSSRLHIEANVPPCCKRSTCTFSTLISLNAALVSA